MMDFSVLMSVYKNSSLTEVQECINSLTQQTVKSNDIVIVIDGEISNDLTDGLKILAEKNQEIKLCPIKQNVGLGNALNYGLSFCKNEIVARMDTDDICLPNRFEKQINCFIKDESLSVVGGNIAEFTGDISNIIGYRIVPKTHEDICKYLKKRCPFNHMTVMFKKSDVAKAGGYKDWHYNEDSYLWIRMFISGCKFYNIQEILVYARINNDTFKRRGGYNYYKSERDLFRFMKKNKVITSGEYIIAMSIRFVVQILMPNNIRQWFFKKFARNTKPEI